MKYICKWAFSIVTIVHHIKKYLAVSFFNFVPWCVWETDYIKEPSVIKSDSPVLNKSYNFITTEHCCYVEHTSLKVSTQKLLHQSYNFGVTEV